MVPPSLRGDPVLLGQVARYVATATTVSHSHVLACRTCLGLVLATAYQMLVLCGVVHPRVLGLLQHALNLGLQLCSTDCSLDECAYSVRACVCVCMSTEVPTLTFKALDVCSQQEPGFVSGGRCVRRFHRGGCVHDQYALRPDPHPCHHPSSTDHRPTRGGLEQAEDSHRPASPDLMGTGIAPGHIISLSANCS